MNTTDIRELLDQRDKIDEQLKSLVNGENGHTDREKRTIKCGSCGEEGHSVRTCSKRG